MKSEQRDISMLKDMLEKRETYINFSPVGTFILGVLYIFFYVFGKGGNSGELVFLGIGGLGIVIVTALSLLQSKTKQEQLLPKSIQFIIGNVISIIGVYLLLTYLFISNNLETYIIPFGFIFYSLLIIVSRLHVQRIIKIFGFILMGVGIFLLLSGSLFLREIVLAILGLGHILLAYLLHMNNKNA